MKKFSNITGDKISEEPKSEIKINEEDIFKTKVLNLMDKLLTIRTYGPVDRYLRAGNIKISGQEMFIEALIDMIKEESLQNETKILESLKISISDWETLDNKIEEANFKINNINKKNELTNHIENLKSLIAIYEDDEELLLRKIDDSCEKINKKEIAEYKYKAAKYMQSDNKYSSSFSILQKISEKYNNRYNNL